MFLRGKIVEKIDEIVSANAQKTINDVIELVEDTIEIYQPGTIVEYKQGFARVVSHQVIINHFFLRDVRIIYNCVKLRKDKISIYGRKPIREIYHEDIINVEYKLNLTF